jgi:hypothetical protein
MSRGHYTHLSDSAAELKRAVNQVYLAMLSVREAQDDCQTRKNEQ